MIIDNLEIFTFFVFLIIFFYILFCYFIIDSVINKHRKKLIKEFFEEYDKRYKKEG